MPYALIDVMAQIVLVTSSAYLLMRSLGMMLRLRRAKNAYPKEVPIANSTPEAGLKSGRYDRHRGALVGLAVGDALGLPAESLPPWLLPLRYRRGPRMQRGLVRFFRRAGAISDDTQLSICVARSISPEGSYLHERFRDELCLWYGYRIAAGRATTQAVRRLRRGNRDDPGDPKSEGNGAAIRVAPLAMAHAEDLDDTDLIADVKDNARLTHRADKAVSGSVFWALLVWEALRHPRSEMSHDALEGLFV
ncbi:MAG: ADP-ribosylglycohydrolase family protein, partial [Deltaproteobacteria bacterium]|nr:ADP-ribosylglycohydrolase family protein [Deltaproteobacteria bacterium]